MIQALTREAEVGKIYLGTVRKIAEFGAFVEIFPGTDGLIHISELSDKRVKSVSDVLKEGDEVMVKVISIDRTGKIRLSRKEALAERAGTSGAAGSRRVRQRGAEGEGLSDPASGADGRMRRMRDPRPLRSPRTADPRPGPGAARTRARRSAARSRATRATRRPGSTSVRTSTASWTLAPLARRAVPTGLAIALPEGFEGQVRPRSGLALRHGITCINAPGTIDADYRGEIQVLLVNLSGEPFTLRRGERIAQLVVAPVVRAELEEVDTLPTTLRGEGGFGSTGR